MDETLLQHDSPVTLRPVTDLVLKRLARNKPVRRKLPAVGAVHIERQLPFLCVYRPTATELDPTRELITTEASYLIAPADPALQDEFIELCAQVAALLHEHFGAFLLLEVWAAEQHKDVDGLFGLPGPAFRVLADRKSLPKPIDALAEALAKIEINGQLANVTLDEQANPCAPGLPPLRETTGCVRIGLEVAAVYRDQHTGGIYPLLFQNLRRQLGTALKQGFCSFAGCETSQPPEHFEALGRRVLARQVGNIDRKLAEIADTYDFLLLVTPVNTTQAWSEFESSGFEKNPEWFYRPLPFDPDFIKRDLFNLPLEHVEDPTLLHLLKQKRDEMDRELTMLRDRGSRQFLYTSLQVFGEVDDALLQLARDLLQHLPPEERDCEDGFVRAEEFAKHATRELEYYQGMCRGFRAKIQIRDDIPAGVMVSRDRLLISSSLCVAPDRVRALLQHEVGTHLLTYFNGLAQPFRQLARGLAHYETLQEGLAVLSEYLVGGLSRSRMRMLASRVIATRLLTDGADFVQIFRELHSTFGFAPRSAFATAARVFRGGGLTKDHVYLRGLHELLQWMKDGHRLAPLLVGKIALEHAPYVRELRRREIIHPAAVRPRYSETHNFIERLERCSKLTVLDLIE